jgi:hypothetical protein
MKHYDPESDKSSVRKYRVDENRGQRQSICAICSACGTSYCGEVHGYEIEIYDVVIDATASDGTPTVYDNRLITSVFVCDECYSKRTRPNE